MSFLDRFFGGSEAARRRAATAVDLAAGVLDECPVCREITDKQRDGRLAAADTLAGEWVRQGDPRVKAFNGDLGALRKALRKVRDRYDVMCTCEGR